MKFLVVMTLFFTLSSARILFVRKGRSEDRGLFEDRSNVNKDIDEFIALIPRAEIEGIVRNWMAKDKEVNQDVAYAASDNSKDHIRALENSTEFRAIQTQLEGVNINVQHFGNIIHEIFGMEPMIVYNSKREKRANTGLRGCLDEIRPKIPIPRIILKVTQKVFLSSQFRNLAGLIRNQDFTNNIKTLYKSEVVTSYIKDAEANGVDVQALIDFAKSLLPIYNALMKSGIDEE